MPLQVLLYRVNTGNGGYNDRIKIIPAANHNTVRQVYHLLITRYDLILARYDKEHDDKR